MRVLDRECRATASDPGSRDEPGIRRPNPEDSG